MKLKFCAQEKEVAAVLREGRWPAACDPALRAHAAACRGCSDLVLVAQALQQLRADTMPAAHVASPGALWWKAQVRRRNAAVERMSRPIAVVEKVALASTAAAGCGLAVWQRTQIAGWLSWLGDITHSKAFRLDALWPAASNPSSGIMVLLIVSLGTFALFGGLAVYWLAEKE
jgi:hypothetical protein